MDASTISLLVSLLFAVIVIAGFLVGMWRGFRRSAVNAVMAIIGAVVAFFVTPTITNAVLGIAIGIDGKIVLLREIVVHLVSQNGDLANVINSNPNLNTLLLNLPSAIINAVLFIVVTIVIQCILYLIYKIIALVWLKIKPKQKKHKVWGGVLGAVKTLLITLFVFMPFTSLVGVASQAITPITSVVEVAVAEEDSAEEQTSTDSSIDLLTSFVGGLDNSILFQACGLFGMDDLVFDYYAQVNVDGQKILIREEVQNVLDIVNVGKEISSVVNDANGVSNIDYALIKNILNKLSKSALFEKVVYQTIGDVIVNYNQYSFGENLDKDVKAFLDPIANDVKQFVAEGGTYAQYFTNNISALIDTVEIFGESGMIDDVLAIENVGINNILKTITNEENIDELKLGLKAIFNVDVIQAIVQPAVQMGVEMIGLEVDAIEVDTSSWTATEWNSAADAIVNVIKSYSNVADEIESANKNLAEKKTLMDVLSDPTILVSEESYNVTSITHNLGQMIDSFRDVKLLCKSNGESIIDSLLVENNIILPAENQIIYNNDGIQTTITNYTQYFDFIAPALVKIKGTGLYSQLKNQTSSKETVKHIARQVSLEGNGNMLAEIILPLYQVEPTKTLIVDVLAGGMGDLIDTTALTSYELWKEDLGYISSVLKTLNTNIVQSQLTYLDLVLENQFGDLIEMIDSTDVDAIFKPMLYGKSTAKIEQTLLTELSSALKEITKGNAAVLATSETFIDDVQADDQATEFCDIIKQFLIINKLGSSFEEINAALKENQGLESNLLGELLDDLKDNAYRNQNNVELNEGIFKGVFIDLITQLKVEYETEINLIPSLILYGDLVGLTATEKERYQAYYDNLNAGTYQNINFVQMLGDFDKIEEYASKMPA